VTLAEAAAEADALAQRGAERELAALRTEWQDELEGAARSADFRERAVAYKAIGQFRFRQKLELLARGLEDESPACRGSALVSLELLSRDHPGAINTLRSTLHKLVDSDPQMAVRRLALVCLRNGPTRGDTVGILQGITENDEGDKEVRATAAAVLTALKKKTDQKQGDRR
jgi:HEAT repeat protein